MPPEAKIPTSSYGATSKEKASAITLIPTTNNKILWLFPIKRKLYYKSFDRVSRFNK